jgi:hypothetical protein
MAELHVVSALRNKRAELAGMDMAESELGLLYSQCLDRRIPDKQNLTEEVAAWEDDRNEHHAKADWHFSAADARIKLKRLYLTL